MNRTAWINLSLVLLVVISVFFFSFKSTLLNRTVIWFSHLDQDSVHLLNALQINDGRAPVYFDHPGHSSMILYGLFFRVGHFAGLIPFHKFSQIEASTDPVAQLATMYYAGRVMSLTITLLMALLASIAFWVWTRNTLDGLGALLLFLSSIGLLLHSLFVRSEQGAMLGVIASSLALALFSKVRGGPVWVLVAGAAFAFALMAKIQIAPLALPFLLAVSWLSTIRNGSDLPKRGWTVLLLHMASTFSTSFAAVWILKASKFPEKLFRFHEWLHQPHSLLLIAFVCLVPILGFFVLRARGGLGWLREIFSNHRVPNLILKYFKIPLALVAGFALGLTAILHFSHSDGNPVAAHFTYERLFDYRAYSQFSGATDGVVSGKGYAAARNHILKFYEFFKYTYPILPVCIALLLVSLLTKVAPMRIVHSLFWLITGLGMCNVSGFRYYSENYWIFSDLFFLTAAMLLIAGIGDRTRPWFRAVLYVVAALFLSCFQYTQIDKAYPGYNGGMRDHLDEAWAGIYPNPDLEKLTKARYGDNATFMARVILDPRLNGSDRGIHLLEKGRVVNLIKNSPELREKLKKGLPDLIKSYGGSGRP